MVIEWTSIKGIAILVTAGMLALFITAILFVSPQGTEVNETSANLSGGPPLLSQGDVLVYQVQAGGKTTLVTVKANGRDAANNCFALEQASNATPNTTACYSYSDGRVVYVASKGNILPSELYAGVIPISAFEPWMVSAGEGWSGGLNVSHNLKPGAIPLLDVGNAVEVTYWYNGTETVFGRSALRIESTTMEGRIRSGKSEARTRTAMRTIWVDAEKRVELKEEGYTNGVFVARTLISAPFPLNSSNS